MFKAAHFLADTLIAALFMFLVHRYLIFWHDWPSFQDSFAAVLGQDPENTPVQAYEIITFCAFIAVIGFILWRTFSRKQPQLQQDSERFSLWSAYIIRFAFWSVFLIGITDTTISALRIENSLVSIFGDHIDSQLGLAKYRGLYVHYPLIALAAFIAIFTRGLNFIWLTLLVVLAEFMIVITRFIFSYEQAYMGDLVRFWYAALFLFASAYTLVNEGHVRVDVIYANLKPRGQAWVNTLGSILLGIPFCATILFLGLETKFSSLASPIINFEISQSGYGLFVKYLMAGFLIIFAVSMFIAFVSYFLRHASILLNNSPALHNTEKPA